MRWMKKLLTAIYLYMGVFFAVCLVYWMATGMEPSSLVMGISTAVGGIGGGRRDPGIREQTELQA